MRAAPRTAPTIISVVFLEELLSGDGGDEEVARGGVISDEELAVLEDFVAKNVVPAMVVFAMVVLDGLEDTVSPFSKNTPFPSSQHG